jgi:hypothetical protein
MYILHTAQLTTALLRRSSFAVFTCNPMMRNLAVHISKGMYLGMAAIAVAGSAK